MFAYPFFALTCQKLKTENNKLNIYTQYLYEINFWNYKTFFSQARRPCGTTHFIRPCTILHASGFGLPPKFKDWRYMLLYPQEIISFLSRLFNWCKKRAWNILYIRYMLLYAQEIISFLSRLFNWCKKRTWNVLYIRYMLLYPQNIISFSLSFIYQTNVKYYIYKVYAAICTRHHQFFYLV